ncbi:MULTISPECIES: signal peptidase II [Alphaproteobacteria]|jgi:signal peptidase II|uniref:Lipoprotein signal peptidase n=1 Tax=Oceanibaculum indicum P24 TaxID=1207063 RepID=K2IYC3_9PROT|nr:MULTISPECIES: signal peptidase II [Alphaproteobacteria]EKE67883.1 lipoprotein signal peptidase [Oceanibaculum indicum P24]MBC7286157.1 signal peptidase II [Hoeflea sp.]MCH2396191.1 signal peptidase II [Oceanibaculum sp.]|tara:strand:- start:382 stop:861 length:480 start_codon:yes stop_codon:yes gene_type:complete
MLKRVSIVATIAAFALLVDQATKWLVLTKLAGQARVIEITNFLNIVVGFNTGVSFGMFGGIFEGRPLLLVLLTLGITLSILIWALKTHTAGERSALALIVGGSLGNVIDRWRQGAVTDFIDFHWGDWHWPTFNGADVFIVAGALMMFAQALRSERTEGQ